MSLRKTWIARLCCALALAAVVALPASANDVITSGADLWQTAGELTYTDFSSEPIPRDFFCSGSRPFDGRIGMRGSSIATEPPGILESIDTIVHRLDDATFDADGVATTRIQVMALSLVGAEPIDVGCDQPFEVTAALAGEQPVTEMKIERKADYGGTYVAPLKLDVRLVFTPVAGGEQLELQREIFLGPASNSYWTTTDKIGTTALGEPVRVDTDGDGVADSALPGPTNFVAGLALAAVAAPACPKGWCPDKCCHCTPQIYNPPWNEPLDNCRPDPNDPTQPDPTHLHCVRCCVPCEVEPHETL